MEVPIWSLRAILFVSLMQLLLEQAYLLIFGVLPKAFFFTISSLVVNTRTWPLTVIS